MAEMGSDRLRDSLIELHLRLRDEQKARWNRSVSFQDELFDRWERAAFLGFGHGTSIYQDALVIDEVKVGADTWIGPGTVLDGSGGLKIGDNCSISAGVQIYTHDALTKRLSDGRMPVVREPTTIGSSCYIGPQSVITRGVTIGHHSVVGAFSLVDRDVPPLTVVHGVPARPRGRVLLEGPGAPRIEWSAPEAEDVNARLEAVLVRLGELEQAVRELRSGKPG